MLDVRPKQGFAELETDSSKSPKCAVIRKTCLTVGTFAAPVFGDFDFPRLAPKCLPIRTLIAFGLQWCPASVSNLRDTPLHRSDVAVISLHTDRRAFAIQRGLPSESFRTILNQVTGVQKVRSANVFTGNRHLSSWQAFATSTPRSCLSLHAPPRRNWLAKSVTSKPKTRSFAAVFQARSV